MYGYRSTKLQKFVKDPEVLATLIEAHKYKVGRGVELEPAEAERLIKVGKKDVAEGLAPVVTDPKLLTKLSRDNRKGVRTSLLKNPNLTTEQIVEVIRRSLKHDKDYEVVAPAAALLEVETLLNVLKEVTRTSIHYTRRTNARFEVSGLEGLGSYRATTGLNEVRNILFAPLREGGIEYLRKLHAAGIEDYFRTTPRGEKFKWFDKGMLTWMAPEMRPELVDIWFETLLSSDISLTADDVRAAKNVISSLPQRNLAKQAVSLHAKHEPEVYRLLMEMGGQWEQFVRMSRYAPDDLRTKFAAKIDDDEVLSYPAADVPRTAMAWDISPESHDELNDADINWLAPEIVNVLAERMLQIALSQSQVRTRRGTGRGSGMQAIEVKMTELVWSVHPDARKSLSFTALVLSAFNDTNRYGSGHRWVSVFRAWASGEFEDKPSAEKVANALAWATALERSFSHPIRGIAEADRVSLFLGKPLTYMETLGINDSRVTYLVAQHYFGDDATAWQMAVDLEQDWDDGIIALAETVCATVGRDLPTEVVDLADKQDEAEEPQEATDSSDELEEDAATLAEEPAEVSEAEEPEESTTEVAPDAEPTPPASTTQEGSAPAEEEDTLESESEDLIPLELTTAVQYNLF